MAAQDLLDRCLADVGYNGSLPEQRIRLILNVVEMTQEQTYRLVRHGLKTALDEHLYEVYREMNRLAYGLIKTANNRLADVKR